MPIQESGQLKFVERTGDFTKNVFNNFDVLKNFRLLSSFTSFDFGITKLFEFLYVKFSYKTKK